MNTLDALRRRYANFSSTDNYPDDITPPGFPSWRQIMEDLESLDFESEQVHPDDHKNIVEELEEEIASLKTSLEEEQMDASRLEKENYLLKEKVEKLEDESDELSDEIRDLKEFILKCQVNGDVPSEDDVELFCSED